MALQFRRWYVDVRLSPWYINLISKSDFTIMVSGLGCILSSSITLLVSAHIYICYFTEDLTNLDLLPYININRPRQERRRAITSSFNASYQTIRRRSLSSLPRPQSTPTIPHLFPTRSSSTLWHDNTSHISAVHHRQPDFITKPSCSDHDEFHVQALWIGIPRYRVCERIRRCLETYIRCIG